MGGWVLREEASERWGRSKLPLARIVNVDKSQTSRANK